MAQPERRVSELTSSSGGAVWGGASHPRMAAHGFGVTVPAGSVPLSRQGSFGGPASSPPAMTIGDAEFPPSPESDMLSRVTVALPRSILYLDESDKCCVALCCEKTERRADTLSRYRELLAFYNFVLSHGDRVPTPDEARTFFLELHTAAAAARSSPKTGTRSSAIRSADASTPPPDARPQKKGSQRGQSGRSRSPSPTTAGPAGRSPSPSSGGIWRANSNRSPRGTPAAASTANPIAGAASHVSRGHGAALALRVGVVPVARETGNSMHLVANSAGRDEDGFAPCLHCTCDERSLCSPNHAATYGGGGEPRRGGADANESQASTTTRSPRKSRYIMACERWLDITPAEDEPRTPPDDSTRP